MLHLIRVRIAVRFKALLVQCLQLKMSNTMHKILLYPSSSIYFKNAYVFCSLSSFFLLASLLKTDAIHFNFIK